MKQSEVAFGTSGVRGLVVDMTDLLCYHYTQAFLLYLSETSQWKAGQAVVIGGDLRFSTCRIMTACAQACFDMGANVINAGNVPSPAVALYGFSNEIPSIMVTGSHIPDDRNGIKFNTPTGEILKLDELGIIKHLHIESKLIFNQTGSLISPKPLPSVSKIVREQYITRYIEPFQGQLQGKLIGVYQHSSVGRDIVVEILESLGTEVTILGRSEAFISVDTEAIRLEDVVLAHDWAQKFTLDAIVSMDGDADRPLISDEKGNWLRGDILGILCAKHLGCSYIVTPISSNTAVEKSTYFKEIVRCKIGSPYVIQGMKDLLCTNKSIVCGYEANGGFLLANDVKLHNGVLKALPTRDAIIVILSILAMSHNSGAKISDLVAQLPERYTVSDRIKKFPTQLSIKKLGQLCPDGSPEAQTSSLTMAFGAICGKVIEVNQIDGIRMTFENTEVIHLRPSGNAPELRCYTEAGSEDRAKQINMQTMSILNSWLI